MVTIRPGRVGEVAGGVIGTALGGPVGGVAGRMAGTLLGNKIQEAVVKAGYQQTNQMSPEAAHQAAPDVAGNVLQDPKVQEILREFEVRTNNEPASKSWVTQGSTAGIVGGAVAFIMAAGELLGYDWSPKAAALTVLVGGAVAMAGPVWALIGRWRKRKVLTP